MGRPAIHGPLSISSEESLAWAGELATDSWNVDTSKSVTMPNTDIFNSDTRFVFSAANSEARAVLNAENAYMTCTSNGTLTITTDNAVTVVGTARFTFMAFRSNFTTSAF